MADQTTPVRYYGSRQCPECCQLKSTLNRKGVAYEFLDIADLPTLKRFLALRDTDPQFEQVRARSGVGIPCIVRPDGTCTLDWQAELGIAADEVVDEQTALAEQAADDLLDGRGPAGGSTSGALGGETCPADGSGC